MWRREGVVEEVADNSLTSYKMSGVFNGRPTDSHSIGNSSLNFLSAHSKLCPAYTISLAFGL